MKVKEKTNTVTTKVNAHANEGAFFVVQLSTSASRGSPSISTEYVRTRCMFLTTTEVTSYPRTAPQPSRLSELCHSILLLSLKAALFISE